MFLKMEGNGRRRTIGMNLLSRMQTRAMMLAKIVTAVIGIAVSYAGTYGWGINGVGSAAVIFSEFLFVWLMLVSLRLGGTGAVS
ncbi:MAG: hypothetical protein HYY84_01670 [Deltaproteobacteria bacterium]|nr:hypothetical protein [Deltaproteobacteria bacterium]